MSNLSREQASSAKSFSLERIFHASAGDIWSLWTTKSGIESWWGPGGFKVEVRKLDLRPGGELLYAMIAVDPEKIEFMRSSGMPTTTDARITYVEIEPKKRLVYRHTVDFVPGVTPYDVNHIVTIEPLNDGRTRMLVTVDAMHDEEWNRRMVAGWEEELEKLDAVIAGG